VRWFLPKSDDFLTLFQQASDNIVAGATLFHAITLDPSNLKEKVERLKEIEHIGDRLTHETMDLLNQRFITPFDREDIHSLISSMDDIIDVADAAAQRILLFRIETIPTQLQRLAEILLASTKELQKAVMALQDTKRHSDAIKSCVEVNRLENDADVVHREALGDLFANSVDAITIIKLKDLYGMLESGTDRCEDVANVIQTIIIKAS
jgi:predicted phosphate transport protein (TIGR00153 family)